MKKRVYLFAILLNLFFVSHAQEKDCQINKMDSVIIEYRCLEFHKGMTELENRDIILKLKPKELSIYDVDNNPGYLRKITFVRKTSNGDTISMLFRWIKFILDNPPIINSDIVFEGFDSTSITVFDGNQECKFSYCNSEDYYYPFAYARLYNFMQQFPAHIYKD